MNSSKKYVVVASALALGGLCLAPQASAIPPDPTTAPEQCVNAAAPNGQDYIIPTGGPSRAPHYVSAPDCTDYPEICVILIPGANAYPPPGPARAPHGGTPTPCAGFDPACVFTLTGEPGQVLLDSDPPHQQPETSLVEVSADCQEIINLRLTPATTTTASIPATGSNPAPTAAWAVALVALGGLLLSVRRRLSRI